MTSSVYLSYMDNSAYSGKYTFFVFLTCDQKNVKSHVFLDFQKNEKNVFSNYGDKRTAQ